MSKEMCVLDFEVNKNNGYYIRDLNNNPMLEVIFDGDAKSTKEKAIIWFDFISSEFIAYKNSDSKFSEFYNIDFDLDNIS